MQYSSALTQLANLIIEILQKEWQQTDIPEPSLDFITPDSPAFISVKEDKFARTIPGAAEA
jgi:hypothetical protein